MFKAFGSSGMGRNGISRRTFLELGAPIAGLGLAQMMRLRAEAGAAIVRVHDVAESAQFLQVWHAIRSAAGGNP